MSDAQHTPGPQRNAGEIYGQFDGERTVEVLCAVRQSPLEVDYHCKDDLFYRCTFKNEAGANSSIAHTREIFPDRTPRITGIGGKVIA